VIFFSQLTNHTGEVIDFHKQPEIRNKNFSELFCL